MFGKNEVAKQRPAADGLLVKEVFYTIQGEGPWAGQPAIFARLAGCNLRCFFCDTDFAGGTKMSVFDLLARIQTIAMQVHCRRIVLTGGEPLLQEGIVQFIDMACRNGLLVQIETAGTVWPEGLTATLKDMDASYVTVVVSPKTPVLHREVYDVADAFKYIIRAGEVSTYDGLPTTNTQREQGPETVLSRPLVSSILGNAEVYVQPCDEGDPIKNKANIDETVRVAMKYGYRVSLQMHKMLGVP